jgi:sugar phosphate isomerase/epimerase
LADYFVLTKRSFHMQISFATANLFARPFEQVLQIIAEAGVQNIELDLYWMRKEWAMAQHLKDMPVRRVVQLVDQAGLRVSSIHDGGGGLENEHSILGFINPSLEGYLDALGYAPDCLVFHTPHIEGNPGDGWWQRTSEEIVRSLEPCRKACSYVTIENMPSFDGYFVPLIIPEALNAFAADNGLGVTLDTTHYAQIGTDIVAAARVLGRNVKTIHLSDFKAGQTHVFIGEGELDLAGFFDGLDKNNLNAVTLECSLSSETSPSQEMSCNELVGRLREAHTRLKGLLNCQGL